MATTQMDPAMMQKILDSLSDVQRRSRRAKRLRGQQTGYEAMRDKEIELGGMTAPVTRGLTGTSRAAFDPIGSYIPNYQGMADKMIGGIGSIYGGKQADMAEDELNAARNPAVLEATEMLGQEGGPSDATIRAYLAGMDQEGDLDLKDIVGKAPHVSSRDVLADGTIVYNMSDGNTKVTDMKAKWTAQGWKMPDGTIVQVGTSGAGLGKTFQGSPAGYQHPPSIGGGDQAPPLTEEQGGPPQGNAPTTVTGLEELPPEKQAEVGRQVQFMNDQGIDPAIIERYVMTEVAKATGTPDEAGVTIEPGVMPDAAGSVPPAPVGPPPPVAAGAVPQPGPVPGAQVAAPPPPVPAPAPVAAPPPGPSTAPYQGVSDWDAAGRTKQAQIDAELAASDRLAAAAAQKEAATGAAQFDAKTMGAARAALPDMQTAYDSMTLHGKELLAHPGFAKVVGSGLWPRLGKIPGTEMVFDLTQAGTPAAGAAARLSQIKNEVFMPAFETLKGGGQITDLEGKKASAALSRMDATSDPVEFKKAMDDFFYWYNVGIEKIKAVIGGDYSAGRITQPGGPAYRPPAGVSADRAAELKKKYSKRGQ